MDPSIASSCAHPHDGCASVVPSPSCLYHSYGTHVYVATWLSGIEWAILLSTIFYFMHRTVVHIIRSHQERVYWSWDSGGEESTQTTTGLELDGQANISSSLIPPSFSSPPDPVRLVLDTRVSSLRFPGNFLFGVSTSAHQIEGGDGGANQWSAWERAVDASGRSRIKDGTRVQSGSQHWLRVDEDIKLMTQLGVNAYRFSIEWSKIQPSAHEFSSHAIAHYQDEIDRLLAKQIKPMITLQHFTIPSWFEELGGFEKEENIDLFVTFAKRMFQEFRSKVRLWVTINEPFFYSFNGYMSGQFPPGKTSPALCGLVLRNLLESHVRVYTAFKSLMATDPVEEDEANKIKIGIVHCIYHFDCWNPLNPFNTSVLQFFETGDYHWRPVGHTNTHWRNPSAVNCLDFIGLNYHSHSFVRYRFRSFFFHNPIEIMLPHASLTLMSDATNACLYPEGLYRSIMQLAKCLPHIPIFVTENGIADAHDDRRHLYLRRHMYALSKAIADGANVAGYFYWTLIDSFEWHEGESLKFGLYHLDKRSQVRTLRDGAKYYVEVCRVHAKRVIDVMGKAIPMIATSTTANSNGGAGDANCVRRSSYSASPISENSFTKHNY